MEKLINEELHIEVPEGFELMSEEELLQAFNSPTARIVGFWNKEKHIMIPVFHNTTNRLLAALADSKGVLKTVQASLARTYGSSFQATPIVPCTAAGKKAGTFDFDCRIKDIGHHGKTTVFLNKATCYNVYLYVRKTDEAEGLKIYQQVLDSLRFE